MHNSGRGSAVVTEQIRGQLRFCIFFEPIILSDQGSRSTQGQFGNAAAFKIIAVSCAVEIISCEENQLSVW